MLIMRDSMGFRVRSRMRAKRRVDRRGLDGATRRRLGAPESRAPASECEIVNERRRRGDEIIYNI